MTKIMIVEDDKNIISSYHMFLAKDKNLSIVSSTENGREAIRLYRETKPDIVLLDLELSDMNGIEVINHLSKLENNDKKCNIIVISGNAELRNNLYNTQKVYRVLQKPMALETLYKSILDFREENQIKDFPTQKLKTLLLQFNLNIHSTSATHLIDVIKYSYFYPFRLQNINNIYANIAHNYNTTADSIRSSIRSAIRSVNKYADKELLGSIFFINENNFNKVLSPVYFVECIIDYLDREI